ncbi:MAG TPA: FAD-binding oxidoreductase, partial [Lutibacter sp.]|nr:FAD-binding oxidoreductase [Lutibacter sp.]
MESTAPIKEFYTDNLHKRIYATDASVYRQIPNSVAFPKNNEEIKKLINYAQKNKLTITPRAAGTSLGGQCVTDGLVVDISRHFTKILNFNLEKKTVVVQPGVIRDQLNDFLKPHGLFFGPNTSTTNRCTLGGMVGNNSSGTTSIQYGVTRDKVMEIKAILSDGSEVIFKDISKKEIESLAKKETLEGKIYHFLNKKLSDSTIQNEIRKEFPKAGIHRRNNGYAVDSLIETNVYSDNKQAFNLSKLIAGSEGTLAFITEITLQLDELPPKHNIVVAAHFNSIAESMKAVVVSMQHNLYMCELMDKVILDQTKDNRTQEKNRAFIEGDPAALLLLEVVANTEDKVSKLADNLINALKTNNMGYAYPKLTGKDVNKATNLRAAGLGLLGSIIGDNKAVACIEDTAVALEDLPDYIEEFDEIMKPFKQNFVYYAHAGAGEIHLRPILNLKKSKDVKL